MNFFSWKFFKILETIHQYRQLYRSLFKNLLYFFFVALSLQYFIGYMVHRLLLAALGRRELDDRDHIGFAFCIRVFSAVFKLYLCLSMFEYRVFVWIIVSTGKAPIEFEHISFNTMLYRKEEKISEEKEEKPGQQKGGSSWRKYGNFLIFTS